MKFSCDNCQARYQIPDEKVAGRKLKYRCRKCEHDVILDGTTITLPAGSPEAAAVRGAPLSPIAGANTMSSITPASASMMPLSMPPPSAPPAAIALPAFAPVATAAAAPKPRPAPAPAAMPAARAPAAPAPAPVRAPAPMPARVPAAPAVVAAAAPAARPPARTSVAPPPRAPAPAPAPAAPAPKPAPVAKPAASSAAHTPAKAPAAHAPASAAPSAHAPAVAAAGSRAAATSVAPVAPVAPVASRAMPPLPAHAPAMPELPVWHVAIAGKPVGPFRVSDVEARIRSGELEAASLAWREGQADWLALSVIPDLAVLLSPPAPPPAVDQGASSDELEGDALPAPSASAPRVSSAPAPFRVSIAPVASAPAPDSGRPSTRPAPFSVRPAPASLSPSTEAAVLASRISVAPPAAARATDPDEHEGEDDGSDDGVVSSARVSYAPPPSAEAAAPASIPPTASDAVAAVAAADAAAARSAAMAELAARAIAASLPPAGAKPPATAVATPHTLELAPSDRDSHARLSGESTQRSPMFWAIVAGAAAFGAVFAWFAAQQMFPPPVPAGTTDGATADNAGQSATGNTNTLADDALEDVGDDELARQLAGLVDAGAGAQATPPATPRTSGSTGSASGTGATGRAATSDSEALPMPVGINGTMTSDTFDPTVGARTTRATTPLDATQISAVVRRSQTRAQRCYEVAATMNGRAPDMRLSVTLRIDASGTVSSATIDGADFGGVIACVRRTVMTWQFPASSAGGQTTFSLVFTGS